MKIPNLRLYETQATASLWISFLSIACIAGLTFCYARRILAAGCFDIEITK